MTAPKAPGLALPLPLATEIALTVSSSVSFSVASSTTFNPQRSLWYRSVATGETLVLRSAFFSKRSVGVTVMMPRVTSC